MAVADTKSTAVSNADINQPRVQTQSWIEKANIFAGVATVEVAAADDDGSVYRMLRVPSGCRIHKLEILSDAIAGGTAFDVGVYADHDGDVVDADLFAANVDLSAGNTQPIDVTFHTLDISKIEQRLWELLGLEKDPFVNYVICLTGDTVGSGAGTVSMRVEYAI